MMAGQPVRVAVIGPVLALTDPHLVHEFVSALVERREPFPNARRSADWTCVGLCAHGSALEGGELVRLPEFTLR